MDTQSPDSSPKSNVYITGMFAPRSEQMEKGLEPQGQTEPVDELIAAITREPKVKRGILEQSLAHGSLTWRVDGRGKLTVQLKPTLERSVRSIVRSERRRGSQRTWEGFEGALFVMNGDG